MTEPGQRHWIRSHEFRKMLAITEAIAALFGLLWMALSTPHAQALHYWWVFVLTQMAVAAVMLTALWTVKFGLRGTL